MAIRLFEHEDVDHSQWVECDRMGQVVVFDKDQRAFDKVMMDIRLV
jgi:hypothetical protein